MPGPRWNLRNAAFVVLAAASNFALAGVLLVLEGAAEEGTKIALRATARVAFLWFVTAYAAAPLHVLAPGRATRWLLAHRRFVGASFAAAFLTHVAMIVWLYRVAPVIDTSRPVPAFEVVGGVFGLATIYAMLVTSFDRAAAALGRRRWRLLHRWGSAYVMVVFIYCFAESSSLYYQPFLALAAAAVALRLWAARKRRSHAF